MKKKVVIIHPALAPYRIDIFNKLSTLYNLKIFFINETIPNHLFNNDIIFSKVKFKYEFTDKGFNLFGRPFRFNLVKKVLKEQPNILIVQEYSIQSIQFIILRALKIIKIKNISILTDDNIYMLQKENIGLKIYLKLFLTKFIDNIIVLSEEVKKEYMKLGLEESKIIIQPLIQDEKSYRKELSKAALFSKNYIERFNLINKRIVLFVGRFSYEKGLHHLLKAFKIVSDQKPNIILVCVGNGPELSKIIKQIEDLKLKNKVILPGRFESVELLAWFNIADLFVLASTFEPYGAVVNEALLAGVPVVINNKIGAKSLITNENQGSIINCENYNDFARTIIDRVGNCINNKMPKESLMSLTFEDSFREWNKLI